MTFTWINSTGGPSICATSVVGKDWRGTEGSSLGVSVNDTDYDRACKVIDYVTVLPASLGQVLVLGDEPFQSTFVCGDEVVIARWVSCESGQLASEALASIPASLPVLEEEQIFEVSESRLWMFDSSIDGLAAAIAASEASYVDLVPGRYGITTESLKRASDFEFIVHRLLYRGRPGSRD